MYLEQGFPAQAEAFIEVLADFYGTELPLAAEQFEYEEIFCGKI